jgi:hypothetical protein
MKAENIVKLFKDFVLVKHINGYAARTNAKNDIHAKIGLINGEIESADVFIEGNIVQYDEHNIPFINTGFCKLYIVLIPELFIDKETEDD